MNPTDTLFDVRGMHCGSCARRVTQALDRLEGVREVRVSLPDKTVRVQHDPARQSAAELAAAITAAGYPAAPHAP